MEKIIMGILTNPEKCKLFLEIQKCGETTAKHFEIESKIIHLLFESR